MFKEHGVMSGAVDRRPWVFKEHGVVSAVGHIARKAWYSYLTCLTGCAHTDVQDPISSPKCPNQ